MYAAMKRDIDKKRSKRDNLILDVGLAVTLGFVVISMRICLAGKWNTVAFGTLVPFVVAVQTYPRKVASLVDAERAGGEFSRQTA